jgi:hypothetical protein
VVGRKTSVSSARTVFDLGRGAPALEPSAGRTEQAPGGSGAGAAAEQDPLKGVSFATLRLRHGIDTVVLGSQGLW